MGLPTRSSICSRLPCRSQATLAGKGEANASVDMKSERGRVTKTRVLARSREVDFTSVLAAVEVKPAAPVLAALATSTASARTAEAAGYGSQAAEGASPMAF